MKVIRISNVIHEHLKKEAQREGRTLQWVVEDRLARSTSPVVSGEAVRVAIPPVASEVKGSPRTYRDVLRDINTLEPEIEKLKLEGADNQDPDYWEFVNEKQAEVKTLWAEYHQLKGE